MKHEVRHSLRFQVSYENVCGKAMLSSKQISYVLELQTSLS